MEDTTPPPSSQRRRGSFRASDGSVVVNKRHSGGYSLPSTPVSNGGSTSENLPSGSKSEKPKRKNLVTQAKKYTKHGRALSYSSFLREDSDGIMLYQQIRQAFLTSGAMFLGLGVGVLLYYNYIMLQPYIIPFFWAVTFSVLLRKPRAHLLTFLEGLKDKERRLKNYPFWHIWWAKTQFFGATIRHPQFSTNLLHFLAVLLGIFVTCGYFGWWLSSPILFFLVIPSTLALMVAAFLVVLPSTHHTTFVSVTLLLAVFVAMVLGAHFFAVKTLDEGSRFALRIQALVSDIVTDERWIATLNEYKLTPDQLKTHIDNAQGMVNTWLLEKGIHLDELKKELDVLGGMTQNSNITAGDRWKQFTSFWQNDTSLTGAMAYVGNMNMERIGDQFKGVMGFLFGTVGIGLLNLFGRLGVSFLNLITGSLVFYTSLFYLIEWDASVLDKIIDILPVVPERKPAISQSLQQSVKSIFVCSYLLCLTHGLVTFILFKTFGMEFAYSASFITAAIAIFPFIPTLLVYLVAAMALYIQEDPYLMYFIVGTIVAQIGLTYSDQYIYQWIPRSHPYLTGLAVVLGVSTFGLEGLVIGPLLIVFTITAYDIFDLDLHS